MPAQGLIFLIFLVGAGFALVSAIKGLLKKDWQKLLPLGIYVVSFLLFVFVPWTGIWLDLNYKLHERQRQDIVETVLSGELKPNVSYNNVVVELPDDLRSSSKTGRLFVRTDGATTEILFFTFAGILDNYSGFIYTTSSSTPTLLIDDDVFDVQKIEEHWYWISSA